MISVEEAISIIKNNSNQITNERQVVVEKANGCYLSRDINSPIDLPSFRQSAMDGYAIFSGNFESYKVVNEIKAGDTINPILKPGEAVRIFTGAAVPDSADVVLIQEKVTLKGNQLFSKEPFRKNQNIRSIGEQVLKNQIALEKGTKITPATVGYLYSLGIQKVWVYKKPVISIISTGNELVELGDELEYGKIYESNSKMLLSALYSLKFYDVKMYKVEDNYDATVEVLEEAINASDLVLISGGISVGKYDYVGKALKMLEVKKLFYKVKQKPGKPLYYGKKEEIQIFGLPGNPAAALTCFYVYVFISLQRMMGKSIVELPRVNLKSKNEFTTKGGRSQFLKAIFKEGCVEILEGQSSAMMQTFAICNALVFLPEVVEKVNVNDILTTILFPV